MDLAEMPGRLEALLRANGEPADVKVTDLTPIVGGYSLVMASFTATSSSGGSRTLVVRADPPADAALTHTDRTREWELLSSLTSRGEVPMPAARMADLTGEHLGRPGIVLDFVDGTQLGTHLSSVDPASYPDLSAALPSRSPPCTASARRPCPRRSTDRGRGMRMSTTSSAGGGRSRRPTPSATRSSGGWRAGSTPIV